MKTLTRCFILATLLSAGSGTVADAQQFTGGIRGKVADANGVIPGATVTVTNEATNVSRDTVTNEAGEYNVPALTSRALLHPSDRSPATRRSNAVAFAFRRSSSSRST